MNTYAVVYGIPIVEVPALLTKTLVREHRQRPERLRKHWARRDRYHARIQKKWTKRFGYRTAPDPHMYAIGSRGYGPREIHGHPATCALFWRRVIDKHAAGGDARTLFGELRQGCKVSREVYNDAVRNRPSR